MLLSIDFLMSFPKIYIKHCIFLQRSGKCKDFYCKSWHNNSDCVFGVHCLNKDSKINKCIKKHPIQNKYCKHDDCLRKLKCEYLHNPDEIQKWIDEINQNTMEDRPNRTPQKIIYRSKSKDRSRSKSKDRSRSKSKDRSRSKSKDRSRSKSKDRYSYSSRSMRKYSRSRSSERYGTRQSNSRRNDRSRSRSYDRRRSESRSRSRESHQSNSKKRNRSRSKSKENLQGKEPEKDSIESAVSQHIVQSTGQNVNKPLISQSSDQVSQSISALLVAVGDALNKTPIHEQLQQQIQQQQLELQKKIQQEQLQQQYLQQQYLQQQFQQYLKQFPDLTPYYSTISGQIYMVQNSTPTDNSVKEGISMQTPQPLTPQIYPNLKTM